MWKELETEWFWFFWVFLWYWCTVYGYWLCLNFNFFFLGWAHDTTFYLALISFQKAQVSYAIFIYICLMKLHFKWMISIYIDIETNVLFTSVNKQWILLFICTFFLCALIKKTFIEIKILTRVNAHWCLSCLFKMVAIFFSFILLLLYLEN